MCLISCLFIGSCQLFSFLQNPLTAMNVTFVLCLFFIAGCSSLPYKGTFSSSSSSAFASSSSYSSSVNRRSSSSFQNQPHKPKPWAWMPPMGAWNHPPPPSNVGPQGSSKPWTMGPPPRQGAVSPTYTTTAPSILNKAGFSKVTQTPPPQNSVTERPDLGCRVGSKVYRVGDKWTSAGGCGRQTCTGIGKVSTLGCPSPEPTDQCTLTETDPRQPWPQCCPQLKCKE